MAREDHQRLKAVTDRIATCHERGTRRCAHGHPVERLAPDACGGEPVDVRCFDLAAAVAEVGVAEIVGHDEHDVGLWIVPACGRQCERGQKECCRQSIEHVVTHVCKYKTNIYLLPGVAFNNCSIAWSTVKLEGFCRGGNCLNDFSISPTMF